MANIDKEGITAAMFGATGQKVVCQLRRFAGL
jgi:hypothetical protein